MNTFESQIAQLISQGGVLEDFSFQRGSFLIEPPYNEQDGLDGGDTEEDGEIIGNG